MTERLTPTETRVLALLCRGLSPKEVAFALGTGMASVRTHITRIKAKRNAPTVMRLVLAELGHDTTTPAGSEATAGDR